MALPPVNVGGVQDPGGGTVLVVDEICDECQGCGRDPDHHDTCKAEDHADLGQDVRHRRDDADATANGCASCDGRRWFPVQGFNERAGDGAAGAVRVRGEPAGGGAMTTADRSERRNLERMRAVVEELRQVQARRDELLAQRHDLAAQLIATGNWSFSALATEMGYERTQLAVEFRRRTKQAEKRRETAE
jgi:hypothetical protein